MEHAPQNGKESPFAQFSLVFGIFSAICVPVTWAAGLLRDKWDYAARLYANMQANGARTAAAVALASIILGTFALLRKEEKKNGAVVGMAFSAAAIALTLLYFGNIGL